MKDVSPRTLNIRIFPAAKAPRRVTRSTCKYVMLVLLIG